MKSGKLFFIIAILAITIPAQSMDRYYAAQAVKTPAQRAQEEKAEKAARATEQLKAIIRHAVSPFAMYELRYRFYNYGKGAPDALRSDEMRKILEARHAEIKDLLAQGANPNVKIRFRNTFHTPLALAASLGSTPVVNSLVIAGADTAIKGNYYLPLMWAVIWNYPEIVEILLKRKADPDIFDADETSALEWAAKKGNYQIVKLLLEAGANPNIKTKEPFLTPLTWAAINEKLEMVEILLQAGARPNLFALRKAAQKGNYQISKLLLDAGARIPINTPNLNPKIIELIRSYTEKQMLP